MFISHHTSTLIFSFFFNATATTEIYTLSLHDALPISEGRARAENGLSDGKRSLARGAPTAATRRARNGTSPALRRHGRSEEHTSELQSQFHLVCRLLLEKKKKQKSKVINNKSICLRKI